MPYCVLTEVGEVDLPAIERDYTDGARIRAAAENCMHAMLAWFDKALLDEARAGAALPVPEPAERDDTRPGRKGRMWYAYSWTDGDPSGLVHLPERPNPIDPDLELVGLRMQAGAGGLDVWVIAQIRVHPDESTQLCAIWVCLSPSAEYESARTLMSVAAGLRSGARCA